MDGSTNPLKDHLVLTSIRSGSVLADPDFLVHVSTSWYNSLIGGNLINLIYD